MAGRRAGANTPPATGQAFAPPARVARGVIVRERRRPATRGVAVARVVFGRRVGGGCFVAAIC